MIKTLGLSSLGSVMVEPERVVATFKSAIVGLNALTIQVGLTDACSCKL